jgi:hypothetical protein
MDIVQQRLSVLIAMVGISLGLNLALVLKVFCG